MEQRVSKLLEQFFSEAEKGSTPVLFINIANQEKYKEIIKKYNFNFFVYDAKERETLSPYFPFLDYIRENSQLKNEQEINEFIEKSKVYYFQRSIFRNFMLGKAVQRDEEINSEEFLYEKMELFNGIKSLVSNLKDKTVFIIKNGDFLNNSTIELIEWIIDKKFKSNFSLIVFFDGKRNLLSDSEFEMWERVLEKAEENEYIYNSCNMFSENINEKQQEIILKKSFSLQQKIKYAKECYNFLAYEEAKELLEGIKIYEEESGKKECREVYRLLGDIFFNIGEVESAITNYLLFLEEAVALGEKNEMCEAYRKLAEAQFSKQNFEISDKYLEQSIKIAEETAEEILILKALYTKIILKNRLEIGKLRKWSDIFFKTEELAKKLRMFNILCRIYGIAVSCADFYESNKEREEVCMQAISLAQKCGNKTRLASLYHNMGMINMEAGNSETAFNYYKKSKQLKIKIGIKNEIARVYNGIGYEFMIMEKFKESLSSFESAFEYLKYEKEYSEIMLTIYNIATVNFYTMNYMEVISNLIILIEIMNIMNITKLPFHATSTIYSMLTISYLNSKKYMKAYEAMTKLKKFYEKTDNEEKIFYFMASAEFLKNENRVEEAEESYKMAVKSCKNDTMKILQANLYFNYYKFIKEFNKDIDKKEKIFEEVKEFAIKKGLNSYLKIYKEIKNGDRYKDFELRSSKIDVNSIVEMARQEINLRKINKKRIEEKLIINIQKQLLETGKSRDSMLKEVLYIIKVAMIAERAAIFLNSIKEPIVYSEYSKEEMLNFIKIKEKIDSVKLPILISDVLKSSYSEFTGAYNSLIIIPLKNKENIFGYLFFATVNKNIYLNADDLKLLSIISQYISMAIINKELSEKLKNKNKILADTIEKMNSIENMVSIIYSESSPEKAIKYILNILVSESVANLKRAFFLEYLEKEQEFLLRVSAGKNEDSISYYESEEKIENVIISDAMENNKIREGYTNETILGEKFDIRNYIIFPVTSQNRKYGVIVIEKDEENSKYVTDLNIMRIFTTNIGIYLENRKYSSELIKTENLRTIAEFSKAIVHELRTPLSGIRGYAKIEKKRHIEDLKSVYHMDMIIAGANSVDEMVKELLEFVNNENKKKISVDLNKIVDKVVEELKYELESEKIEIVKEIENGSILEFNPKQLKKVIYEIVKNSIEASKTDGGTIIIKSRKLEKYIELIIKDSGVGMSKEQLKNLYEPLYSSKIQGTGMGLPIVLTILKRAEAEIEVKSEKDNGTEIKILFNYTGSKDEHSIIEGKI